MKKRYFICYISIVCLVLMVIYDAVGGHWLRVFGDAMFLLSSVMVLIAGYRFETCERLLREQRLLNEKFCKIMAGLAVDENKVSETFEQIAQARKEAWEESKSE